MATNTFAPADLTSGREEGSALEGKLQELREKRGRIVQGGGKDRIDKQHAAGKLTARERIEELVDSGTFQEIGAFAKHRATLFGMAGKDTPADGVVTGCAMIDDRPVHLASQDFTVCGGTAGEVHCAKIVETMKLSLKTGSPFIFINDSGAMTLCRRLLSFLPSNNLEEAPRMPYEPLPSPDLEMNCVVPADVKEGYDVRSVLTRLLDANDFFELQPGFAANVVVGFGRIQGKTVGLVANQPCVLAGVLDINASDKVAAFVRYCNAFNVPLITVVDTPGFLPGVEQEYGGIIRHGAKMLFAYSAATVPKLTVVLRKAYGGAYIGMCCKDLGADRVVAWPTAEIAVMGAESAVEIVFRREIDEAPDKRARRNELIDSYRRTFSNPYVAAGRRLVDDVIEPSETREYLARALESLSSKRETRPPKKHGLIPL
jgi:acetyl-CoA carboxylase carboxyltransferase component